MFNFLFSNGREEYIKLQTRLSEVERENAVLRSSTQSRNTIISGASFDSNESYVEKILNSVAGLLNKAKYR